MKKNLYKLEELVAFRHNMHKNAEIGFQEFKTQKNIITYLKKLGVKDSQITKCAITGLYVDLYGSVESTDPKKLIAFRADIDALETFEGNKDLIYRSTNKAAHLCGHDGHTTCLLAFTAKYLEKIQDIPSNLGIRLLFQPCEEGVRGSMGGAIDMIKNGCLKDVDEVYGFHNWPTDLVGCAYVKSGAVMAEVVQILIKIFGKGGHGSEPAKCNDPIQVAIDIYNYSREVVADYNEKKLNFRFTLPHIEAGSASNVIPDTALIEGTFRSLDEALSKEFIESFSRKIDEFSLKHSCTNEKKIVSLYPPVVNSIKETESILKIAKEFFGEDKITDNLLPFYASEDFSYYLKERPGVFFFLCSARTKNDGYLHTEDFNFNDDLIPLAADFWVKVAEERLGIDKKIFEKNSLMKDEEKEEEKPKIQISSKKIKKKK